MADASLSSAEAIMADAKVLTCRGDARSAWPAKKETGRFRRSERSKGHGYERSDRTLRSGLLALLATRSNVRVEAGSLPTTSSSRKDHPLEKLFWHHRGTATGHLQALTPGVMRAT